MSLFWVAAETLWFFLASGTCRISSSVGGLGLQILQGPEADPGDWRLGLCRLPPCRQAHDGRTRGNSSTHFRQPSFDFEIFCDTELDLSIKQNSLVIFRMIVRIKKEMIKNREGKKITSSFCIYCIPDSATGKRKYQKLPTTCETFAFMVFF